jgi:CTP synthase
MAKKIYSPETVYVFVVGGVISGVGKGVAASSIGKILEDRGQIVTAIKIDPYINLDAGTMSPTEHGEVFVLDDGYETDQDMGNYERFLNKSIGSENYMTTGRVYSAVIEKERAMHYGGKCVEVVPHIPLEVIERIENAGKIAGANVVVIEIGGTVGEYQNMLFLEAARMMKIKHPKSVFFVMVSYLPVPGTIGEMKTKPTQHAVRTLNASGIQPDIIIARSKEKMDEPRKEKLSVFCNIPSNRIISAPDVQSIYDIPGNFEKEGLSDIICETLGLACPIPSGVGGKEWNAFVKKTKTVKEELNIAVVGKYFNTGDFVLSDVYISVIEAIKYSSYAVNRKPVLTWINGAKYETDPSLVKELSKFDGVIVPGGFGTRGIEGKIKAIEYVRKNKIPYLGLCYGMQLAVIEYSRNVLKLKDAHTREVDPKSKNLVIDIMHGQEENIKGGKMGGTMRLGAYPAVLKKGSLAEKVYGTNKISERHRHRYEVNNDYVERLEKAGMIFSGKSPDGNLCEIVELNPKEHPFFMAAQFHPEFLARPLDPHKMFTGFCKASVARNKKK